MKTLKLYSVLLLLTLVACSPLQRVAIPTDPVEATKLAQSYINEANVTLIAVANVVAENRKNEIITVAERDSYVAKLKDFAKRVDDAQLALRTGDINKAFNQAELLKALIIALHREVAAKARQS
jgi:soluble cytochrome b562